MKPVIYIASPYRVGSQAANVSVQLDAGHRVMDLGAYPIVPLLTHYMDIYEPRDEQDWLDMGLEMVRRSDAVLRLPGYSVGADAEVEEARRYAIPVFFSFKDLTEWLEAGEDYYTD